MNETNQAPATGGTKLSTIFMVVLGLHIVVIVVISAFYFMKGRSHPEMAEATAPATTEGTPVANADSSAAPDAAATPPVVETNTAPQISQEMINTMASTGPDSPMPSSSDPSWANTQAEAPDQTATEPEQNLAANLQTPPARLEPKTIAPKTVATTPASAPVKKAAVATVSKGKTYTVVAGDNLTKVAKKNNTTVAQLKKVNGLTADSLKIGQALKVPGSTVTQASTAVASTAPAPSAPAKKTPVIASTTSSASTYQVVKGDTLWKIAKSFGVSPNVLAQTNGLTDPKDLKIGATLKIPRSAAKATAKPAPVREAEASAPVTKFRDPVITMDMARL